MVACQICSIRMCLKSLIGGGMCNCINLCMLLASYLNPECFYKDIAAVKADKEVFKSVMECIEKFVPCEETQDEILYQITRYELAEGLFGNSMAIRQRTTRTTGDHKFSYSL